jgi:hypothetical protein
LGALALLLFPLISWGQTNPTAFDLSTANFSFTGFAAGTTTTYPASMQGHKFAAEPDGTTTAAPSADFVLAASTGLPGTGSIRNEIGSGISILNSGSNNLGAITVALKTTDRKTITLGWVAERILDQASKDNGFRLQYRVGTSGVFTDVSGGTYAPGTGASTPQTFSGVTLPAAADNQAVVQVRWLYYLSFNGSGSRDRLRLDEIAISSSPIITVPVVSVTPACAGSTVTVAFTTSGTHNAGNIFTAELSDVSGNFPGTNIGSITSTTAADITATIPAAQAAGALYKIRVKSSDLAYNSPASAAFTVNNLATNVTPTTAQSLTIGQVNASALTVNQTPAATSQQWYYSTTSGSGYTNAIGGAMGTSYTPQPADFAGAGTYYVVATSTLGGCVKTSNEVQVDVTASAGAFVSVAPATINAFNTLAGVASAAQTLSVSGGNLTNDIIITAPEGYEVSVAGGAYLTTPQNIVPVGGTVAATSVDIRLSGLTATASLGTNLEIRSSGATNQDRTVSGTVVAEPTTAPTVTPSALAQTSVTLTVAAGDGSQRLLVVRATATSAVAPSDQTAYSANLSFGNAGVNTTTGAGTPNANYIVLNGTATSVTVTGLTAATSYQADVYAYNVGSVVGFENYLPTAGNAPFTTLAIPVVTVTPGSLSPFVTGTGNPSAAQTLTVSAINLTNDLIITPPAGYEVSINGGTYSASIQNLVPVGGTVASTSVDIRLTGNTVTASLGTSLLIRSTGATNQDRPVSGTVVTEPTTAPTVSVTAGSLTQTTVSLAITSGNGSKRLLVVRPSGDAAVAPADLSTYTASLAYGTVAANSTTGTNNFVIVAGTTTSAAITGLSANTSYAADVYAYNESGAGTENYLATPLGTTSFSTPAVALLTYNFESVTTPSSSAANISGTTFSRGAGLTVQSATPNYNSSAWIQTAFDATANDYLEFAFTVTSGYQANLTSLVLDERRSGTGPLNWEVRSDKDGYATTIGTAVTVPNNTSVRAGQPITLSGPTFTGLQGTTTFRIYGYNATGSAAPGTSTT